MGIDERCTIYYIYASMIPYIYCGEPDAADWDTMFQECFPFDNIARQHMLSAVQEIRKRVADPDHMDLHHIIPRCFYKDKNLPVDNTGKNLIYVTPEEHLWFHCCCVSCCNYHIKPYLKSPVMSMIGYKKEAQRNGIKNALAAGVHFGRQAIPCPPEEIWRPVIDQVNRNEITVETALHLLHMKRTTFYKHFSKYVDPTRNAHAKRWVSRRSNWITTHNGS